jgi:DNA recombination protein Rad52
MAFSDAQVQTLSGKLSAKHVRTRQANGRTLSYIEGWHAIAEANRIFGFDAWDRQTMAIKCVWEGTWQGKYRCAYVARVRIKVRAGDNEICREGCGSGQGRGKSPGEAHESALKEAETDAMKRALTTFGNPFGLALYDKEQHGVRGKARNHRKPNGQTLSWILLSPEGEVISLHEDPVDYCKALRQVIEASPSPERLRALWGRNSVTIEMLRANLCNLRTEAGEHYADILLSLYQRQLKELHEEQEADQTEAEAVKKAAEASTRDQEGAEAKAEAVQKAGAATKADQHANQAKSRELEAAAHARKSEPCVGHKNGNQVQQKAVQKVGGNGNANRQNGSGAADRVDKSALPISAPRRIRDKEHLRYVASRPCLVCGRSPTQAHHLRFAQPRAIGRKVSDEWTVPLCVTHHRMLHSVGNEEMWWKDLGIDPTVHAKSLWRDSRGEGRLATSRARELIWPTPS